MTLGLDYSAGRLSGAAVRNAGYNFVARYLANGLQGRVNLSVAEVADLTANGVAVAVVWESSANRAAAGTAAGIADAKAAQAAVNACGLAGWPIYFAVDFDVPDYGPSTQDPRTKLGPVGDYFDGVASVLGHARTGGYGGYWAVKRLFDAGLITYGWQTAAWSGGNVDPRIHLFQRIGTAYVGGVACDVNEARQADFGQNPGADVTPEDIQAIAKAVWDYQLSRDGQEPARAETYLTYDNSKSGAAEAAAEADGVKLDSLATAVAALAAKPAAAFTPAQLADIKAALVDAVHTAGTSVSPTDRTAIATAVVQALGAKLAA